jgi:hypothetical protein
MESGLLILLLAFIVLEAASDMFGSLETHVD